MRPVNIHINVNRDSLPANGKSGFNIFRSKFVWLLLTLALTTGVGYARTRYMCQGFKDGGKFYYGMDVSRCVGILIQEPFANLDQQLLAINRRY
ncbi:hypothetical protein GCM10007887_10090 [Methylobacterium haplocladii]|uniref:Uncharacterized protein n=2 Tax=Methylobacterium haplocladii TaxID=1176176 RepID=A0A512ITH6_9HYPH|nr:hypothetical protein MHA02_33910 [Methylobacterium haplocladii]GLS58350.1 hypothetical protein GCM10007887_10090 [Methylobacterium haplocladii]